MRSRLSSVAGLAALLLALLPAAACSGGDSAPPVATVSLEVSKDRAPLGSPIDLTYRFQPAAAIADDYRVFVHVVDSDGTVMWTDDHDPPTPTSSWQPGQAVEYTHTVFVPIYPYLGEARFLIGLHRGNERLPLAAAAAEADANDDRAYQVATLQLLPQAETIFLIYGSGWHPAEYAAGDPTRGWQWTEKSALVSFRNPRQDVTLYLQFDGRPDVFGEMPQNVTVVVEGQALETIPVQSRDATLRLIPVSAAQLGSNDMVELRLDVDRTFFPAKITADSVDDRELGIRVYHVFVEPR
jgi:hypothetical protein